MARAEARGTEIWMGTQNIKDIKHYKRAEANETNGSRDLIRVTATK